MAWTLACARPGDTEYATRNLQRQGFVFYAPHYQQVTVKRGKTTAKTRFLFSNYIFVELVDQWMAIRNTYGISRLLTIGDRPVVVRQEVIDELRSREVDGHYVLPPKPVFTPNQRLKVVGDGLLTGKFCLYQGQSSADRVKVLFDGVGLTLRTEMAITDLEVA